MKRAAFQPCKLKSSAETYPLYAPIPIDCRLDAPRTNVSLSRTLTLPVVQLFVCGEAASLAHPRRCVVSEPNYSGAFDTAGHCDHL